MAEKEPAEEIMDDGSEEAMTASASSCGDFANIKEQMCGMVGDASTSDDGSIQEELVGDELGYPAERERRMIGADVPSTLTNAMGSTSTNAAEAAAVISEKQRKEREAYERKKKEAAALALKKQQKEQKKKEEAAAKQKESVVTKTQDKFADQRVTRKFSVDIFASLNDLAKDPNLSTWRMSGEAAHVFQKEKTNPLDIRDGQRYLGDPTKAVIESFKIHSIINDLPVKVVASSPDIQSNTFMPDGSSYLFAAPSQVPIFLENPKEYYNCLDPLADRHMRKYGSMKMEDVRATVTEFNGKSLVEEDSPIIDVMRINSDVFREHLAKSQRSEVAGKTVYALEKNVVATVVQELETMFSKLPHCNLLNFSLSFRRADGEPWNSSKNISSYNNSEAQVRQLLSKKNKLTVEFEMSHVLTTLVPGK